MDDEFLQKQILATSIVKTTKRFFDRAEQRRRQSPEKTLNRAKHHRLVHDKLSGGAVVRRRSFVLLKIEKINNSDERYVALASSDQSILATAAKRWGGAWGMVGWTGGRPQQNKKKPNDCSHFIYTKLDSK